MAKITIEGFVSGVRESKGTVLGAGVVDWLDFRVSEKVGEYGLSCRVMADRGEGQVLEGNLVTFESDLAAFRSKAGNNFVVAYVRQWV